MQRCLALDGTDDIMSGQKVVPLFRLGNRTPCKHCGALLFPHEKNWGDICCFKGAVVLPPILDKLPIHGNDDPAEQWKAVAHNYLCDMWNATNELGTTLQKYARQVNNALAMASLEVVPRDAGWRPSVIICGKVYTRIGPLINEASNTARKVAQLWCHDPQHTMTT